ncbi:unnamed protein product [Amoebophrya sp. A120]|nr:unnamed protein product [Amoebophrya sp. A120]|eukprot:GSA120T00013202001.1
MAGGSRKKKNPRGGAGGAVGGDSEDSETGYASDQDQQSIKGAHNSKHQAAHTSTANSTSPGTASTKQLDRGAFKLEKMCIHCNRPFSWRKKWERCWDEVQTCSNACKRERKRKHFGTNLNADNDPLTPQLLPEEQDGGQIGEGEEIGNSATTNTSALPQASASSGASASTATSEMLKKSSANYSTKNAGAGAGTPTTAHERRTKECDVCKTPVQLAYRCKWDKSKQWRFVCRPCWPVVSQQEYLEQNSKATKNHGQNKQLPGLLGNPFYVYGGTWKATIGLTKNEILNEQQTTTAKTRLEVAIGSGLPQLGDEVGLVQHGSTSGQLHNPAKAGDRMVELDDKASHEVMPFNYYTSGEQAAQESWAEAQLPQEVLHGPGVAFQAPVVVEKILRDDDKDEFTA